jgi:hypothetical protein
VGSTGVGLGWPVGQGPGWGNGSGPARVEGEVGRSCAESGAGPEFKKKFFLNFI